MTQEFQSSFRKSLSLEKVYKNSVWYRLSCDCMDEDHDTIIALSLEKDDELLELAIYKKMMVDSHYYGIRYKSTFLERIKAHYDVAIDRIKKAIRLLFTGTLEIHSHVILYGEEHVDSLIECLYEGKEHIRECKKKEEELRRIKEDENKDRLCDK